MDLEVVELWKFRTVESVWEILTKGYPDRWKVQMGKNYFYAILEQVKGWWGVPFWKYERLLRSWDRKPHTSFHLTLFVDTASCSESSEYFPSLSQILWIVKLLKVYCI